MMTWQALGIIREALLDGLATEVVTSLTSGSEQGGSFLWKVNEEGTTQWATNAGNEKDDQLYDVTTDAANNVVAVGKMTSSSATYGDVALTRLGSTGTYDAVLWKVSDVDGFTFHTDRTMFCSTLPPFHRRVRRAARTVRRG
jgi:hypothetical protein